MKTGLRTALLALIAAGQVACSTLKVKVGWDQHVDFSKYHTWAWQADGSIQDPTWAKRCQDVLSDQLATHGLKQVALDQSPDLWVVVHARLTAQTQVASFSPAWGYGWGPYGPGWAYDDTVVYQIPVGTLLIDLVDPKLKQIVWRGRAHDAVQSDRTNEQREEKLISVLQQMFAGYPPSPAAAPAK